MFNLVKQLSDKGVCIYGVALTDNFYSAVNLLRLIPSSKYQCLIEHSEPGMDLIDLLALTGNKNLLEFTPYISPYVTPVNENPWFVIDYKHYIVCDKGEYFVESVHYKDAALGTATVMLRDIEDFTLDARERAIFDYMRLVSCGYSNDVFRKALYSGNDALRDFYYKTSKAARECNIKWEDLQSLISIEAPPTLLSGYSKAYRIKRDEEYDYATLAFYTDRFYMICPDNSYVFYWHKVHNFIYNKYLTLAAVVFAANMTGIQMQWSETKALCPKAVMPVLNYARVEDFNINRLSIM